MATTLQSYSRTPVSPAKSREQIEKLLEKIGAKGYRWASTVGYPGREGLEAVIEWKERPLAFRLEVTFDSETRRKQLMRAMYWYLKTKVEAIEMGLVDLEREFWPYLVTSEGRTVFEQIHESTMKLLPSGVEMP